MLFCCKQQSTVTDSRVVFLKHFASTLVTSSILLAFVWTKSSKFVAKTRRWLWASSASRTSISSTGVLPYLTSSTHLRPVQREKPTLIWFVPSPVVFSQGSFQLWLACGVINERKVHFVLFELEVATYLVLSPSCDPAACASAVTELVFVFLPFLQPQRLTPRCPRDYMQIFWILLLQHINLSSPSFLDTFSDGYVCWFRVWFSLHSLQD